MKKHILKPAPAAPLPAPLPSMTHDQVKITVVEEKKNGLLEIEAKKIGKNGWVKHFGLVFLKSTGWQLHDSEKVTRDFAGMFYLLKAAVTMAKQYYPSGLTAVHK